MALLMGVMNLSLGVLLSLAPAETATAAGGEFHWSGRVGAGKAVEIKGVNGAVSASAAGGDQVEVVASKHARHSDPAGVEIKVVEHEGGVTICAVYPSPGGRPNECAPGPHGRMNTHDNDVSVDFVVKVPAGVRFVGRTVNGDIEASGLEADAEAHTVNGSVKISTRGAASAETVNGSVSASLGETGQGPLDFQTVNGSISVTLPAGAGASVHAETVNGAITTDFPLSVQGEISRHRISGTIGGGGQPLELKTVNGGIHLIKVR